MMTPKKWILRFRAVDKDNFLEIKRGLKTIETRAATDRYRKIKRGDFLVISCGKNRLEKKVKNVQIFKSINAMTKKISYKKIMPSVSSLKEMEKVYHGYPGYKEKLKKYGVIALEI